MDCSLSDNSILILIIIIVIAVVLWLIYSKCGQGKNGRGITGSYCNYNDMIDEVNGGGFFSNLFKSKAEKEREKMKFDEMIRYNKLYDMNISLPTKIEPGTPDKNLTQEEIELRNKKENILQNLRTSEYLLNHLIENNKNIRDKNIKVEELDEIFNSLNKFTDIYRDLNYELQDQSVVQDYKRNGKFDKITEWYKNGYFKTLNEMLRIFNRLIQYKKDKKQPDEIFYGLEPYNVIIKTNDVVKELIKIIN